MENFENFDVLYKKLAKLVKENSSLKESNAKLKVENDFLAKEIKNLKKTNFELLEFKDKQNKIATKIRKILSKIELSKGNL